MRKGEDSRAIELLQLSLKHEENALDEKQEMLRILCRLYFKEKSFDHCLDTGRKLKDSYEGIKSEVINKSCWDFIVCYCNVHSQNGTSRSSSKSRVGWV